MGGKSSILERYPPSIIELILSFVGYEGIKHLLRQTHHSFLHQIPNFKYALNRYLERHRQFQYNNKTIWPSKLQQYENENPNSSFLFIESMNEFAVLFEYCACENLNAILTISFEIVYLADFANLKTLIGMLEADSGHAKLNLELRFNRQLLSSYQYHLNRFFDSLQHVNNHLHSIVLRNCEDMFQLDLNKYPNLCNLWLENCNNTQILNLKTLKLMMLVVRPSIERKYILVDLLKLPNTIRKLHIEEKRFTCAFRIDRYWRYSRIPQIITMDDVRDTLTIEPKSYRFVGAKLKCTTSNKKAEAKALVLLLKEFMSTHNSQLASLSMDSEVAKVVAQEGINPEFELICGSLKDSMVHRHLLSPNSRLVKLVLEKVPNPTELMNLIPIGIEHLDLGSSLKGVTDLVPKFDRFEHLRFLSLTHLSVENVESQLTLPNSLEILSIKNTVFSMASRYRFPPKLVELRLEECQIKEFFTPCISPNLKWLYLGRNMIRNVYLKRNYDNEELQIETLDLNNNWLSALNGLSLPKLLKILNCDCCPLGSTTYIDISQSIEDASFAHCGLTRTTHIIASDSNLKAIDLSKNHLLNGRDNLNLPKSIRSLKLTMNMFKTIPKTFCELPNLQILDMSINPLKEARCKFVSESLEVLCLNNTMISEMKLTFPKNTTTQLKLIDLHHNLLTKITWASLGHNPRQNTRHDNLYELNLSLSQISEENILDLQRELPPSVQRFWATDRVAIGSRIYKSRCYIRNLIRGSEVVEMSIHLG